MYCWKDYEPDVLMHWRAVAKASTVTVKLTIIKEELVWLKLV